MRITAAAIERADGVVARRQIKSEAVELGGPREGEVSIEVSPCGVRGTDQGSTHGLEPCPDTGVLGHEGAGRPGGRPSHA